MIFNNRLYPLVPAITLIFSFGLIFVKTFYVFKDLRFAPYGLDSLYYLGQIQHLRFLGQPDVFFNYRLGNILPTLTLTQFIDLLPSQILTVPFFIINLFSFFTIWLLASYFTNSTKNLSLTMLVYAASFIPAPVNDFHLFLLVILPLRLAITFSLINTKSSANRSLLFLFYFLISLISNLTYPILALVFDALTILAIYTNTHSTKRHLTPSIVSCIQITNLLILYIYTNYWHQFSLPIIKIVERLYSTYQGHINPQTLLLLISILLISQLAIILHLAISPKTLRPFAFHTNLSFLRPIIWLTSLYALTVAALISTNFLFNLQFSLQWLPFSQATSSHSTILSLISTFFFISFALRRLPYSNRVSSRFLLTALVLGYFLYIYSPLNLKPLRLLSNERFFLMFLLISILLLPNIISSQKNKFIVASIVIAISLITTPQTITTRFRQPGYTHIVKAMDWLTTQPNFADNIVYAHYFGRPQVAVNHKPHSLYLVPSTTNYEDQFKLGKCAAPIEEHICIQNTLNFARSHDITYFIVENLWSEKSLSQVPDLPKPIFDQTTKIYKLK